MNVVTKQPEEHSYYNFTMLISAADCGVERTFLPMRAVYFPKYCKCTKEKSQDIWLVLSYSSLDPMLKFRNNPYSEQRDRPAEQKSSHQSIKPSTFNPKLAIERGPSEEAVVFTELRSRIVIKKKKKSYDSYEISPELLHTLQIQIHYAMCSSVALLLPPYTVTPTQPKVKSSLLQFTNFVWALKFQF